MASAPMPVDSASHKSSGSEEHPVYDLEKGKDKSAHAVHISEVVGASGRTGVTAPLWRATDWLESRLGVEARGIERVPEDQRFRECLQMRLKEADLEDSRLSDNFTLYLAANCTVSTLALGTLGNSIWFLGFRDAALTIVFFNMLAALVPAYFSTFGKSLGIRALAFSRYSFGYWTALIPTVLNLIACVGWSCLNCIAGGLVLKHATNSHQISLAGAMVVIAVLTLIVTFFGYKIVHTYERWSWIPIAIIFLIVLGKSAPYMETGPYGGSGGIEAASVLSFGGSIVGFALGWVSLAGDYTVNMRSDASNWKLFSWTYAGLCLPMILIELLGAALMTTFDQKTTWAALYEDGSIGGLLSGPLVGGMHGFGSFCMVLLGLSIVGNNIPNMYSFAMTFQVLGPWALAIPRPIIVVFATALYTGLAIGGRNSFEAVLENLLLFLAYWLATFSVIVLEEHLIFRRGKWSNYDVHNFHNWRVLPLGVAALLAVGAGWTGAILGMSTSFYVGHIAKLFGLQPFGGDLGFELAIGFSALVYAPARYIEKRYWGH